jgi:trehalose 6-phosphate synthase/phosphatase
MIRVPIGTPNRRDPDVGQWVQTLTERYAGVKLVVGRDKLDEVQVGPSIFRSTCGYLPI